MKTKKNDSFKKDEGCVAWAWIRMSQQLHICVGGDIYETMMFWGDSGNQRSSPDWVEKGLPQAGMPAFQTAWKPWRGKNWNDVHTQLVDSDIEEFDVPNKWNKHFNWPNS